MKENDSTNLRPENDIGLAMLPHLDGNQRTPSQQRPALVVRLARHDAITRLAQKLNVLQLARMVGHRDIRSLQTYYNETAESMARLL